LKVIWIRLSWGPLRRTEGMVPAGLVELVIMFLLCANGS
jgi:hypothetical protein